MESQSNIRRLKEIYEQYGFVHAKTYEVDNVIVFTLKNGYFHNADIVKLDSSSSSETPFKEFSDSGFAPTIRKFVSIEDAEDQLFKGFFSVDSILDRLKHEYKSFADAITKPYADDATYEYINAPYLIDGVIGENSPYEEVISRLENEKPILFLIEAAAGFGKTCNAYELVKRIIETTGYLPLFSELSMNREARIFKHILLDEIDRKFPVLKSRLVQSEITKGRVITVLDGFDELLRKSELDGDLENREPMLETIGEFLTGKAKIILTTRRTVLFEGDAFHDWVDSNSENFTLVTIKLNEPRVTDWLIRSRINALENSGLKIENMSNPVLLSYLRCISDEQFASIASNPDELVNNYFSSMMEREKTRQDLPMQISAQVDLLISIAKDMYEYGYTSESRDYVVAFILETKSKLIEQTIQLYPIAKKPNKEELANKLASHALLDRSIVEPNKIGFINEFVFGHFLGINILNSKEWLNDDYRFIEPAVLSYQPRSRAVKNKLWSALKYVNEFLEINNRVNISIKLKGSIDFELIEDEINRLTIEHILIGDKDVKNFQFNDCTIKNCILNLNKFENVTFLNCKFYDNEIKGTARGVIYVLGGEGDEDFLKELTFQESTSSNEEELQAERTNEIEKYILEKFWPTGREYVVYKHRPLTIICREGAGIRTSELFDGVERLKKKNILNAPRDTHFIEINFESLALIRTILLRD